MISFLMEHFIIFSALIFSAAALGLELMCYLKTYKFQVDVHKAVDLLNKKAILIDSRTQEEIKEYGFIKNAIFINLEELSSSNIFINAKYPIIMYCQAGFQNRQLLKYINFYNKEIYFLGGGIEAWISSGMPITKGDN